MKTLKTLRTRTRKAADHFALKPIATIVQAARPMSDTKKRPMLHSPRKAKPMKRKIKSTRPASKKLRAEASALGGAKAMRGIVLFLAVRLTQTREPSKERLARVHRVAEDHEKTADDREVAQEETEVENETIADCLHDDDG